MIKLIDVGANLTHESFRHDLAETLDRAADVGVHALVVTGTSVAESQAAIELALSYPRRLYATAGVHPHEASHFDASVLEQLRALCAAQQCVAVGEAGLDYHRNFSPPDAQRAAFIAQLELAAEQGMPVFIHERDAAQDMLKILKDFRAAIPKMLVHCFTGSAETLQAYLDLDIYIGITGWICDERRGQHLQTLVKTIPSGRLMIETDCPYLMPRDYPDKKALHSARRNEPCTLRHTAETIARCRGESLEELARHTCATSVEFFGLDGEPEP